MQGRTPQRLPQALAVRAAQAKTELARAELGAVDRLMCAMRLWLAGR